MSSIEDEGAPWILVTNDDGIDSPALVPLLRTLSGGYSVRAVVPASECSWSAKRMTRFGELRLEEAGLDGFAAWSLTGSPADCVNLGIHSLHATKPRLVVSGINIGANAGLSFLLSSGTVGAAIEGVLSGVEAAAFSAQLHKQDYDRWRERRNLDSLAQLWESAAEVTLEIVAEILDRGLPQGASLLSVNMPPQTSASTPRQFTEITKTDYGRFFRRTGCGRFEHEFSGLEIREPKACGDVEVLERGVVAITPIRLGLEAEPSDGDRRRFERG